VHHHQKSIIIIIIIIILILMGEIVRVYVAKGLEATDSNGIKERVS
jgi:hypothetical protein